MPVIIGRHVIDMNRLRKYIKKPIVRSKFMCFGSILLSLIAILILDSTKEIRRMPETYQIRKPVQTQEHVEITQISDIPMNSSHSQSQSAQREHDRSRAPEEDVDIIVSESSEEAPEQNDTPDDSGYPIRKSNSSVYIPYGILEGDYSRVKDLGIYKIVGYDAYCSHCVSKEVPDGITASGVKATVGRTVATHKSIPFGTILEIEGLGYYVVEDRGVDVGMVDVASANHNSCYLVTSHRQVWIVEEMNDEE